MIELFNFPLEELTLEDTIVNLMCIEELNEENDKEFGEINDYL